MCFGQELQVHAHSMVFPDKIGCTAQLLVLHLLHAAYVLRALTAISCTDWRVSHKQACTHKFLVKDSG